MWTWNEIRGDMIESM